MKTRKKRRPISMAKITELLRLKELGISISQAATSCNCSRATVKSYWESFDAAGLNSTDLLGLGEEEALEKLNRKRAGRNRKLNLSDEYWSVVNKELSKKGQTLYLQWEAYSAQHSAPMSYSNYCLRYREWRKKQKITYRQTYKGGEKLFVDFSGLTVPLAEGGVAQIFVGALGASNLTYVEATPDQSIESWIGVHVRMFSYIGGTPELLIPDNLRSGVTDPDYYEPDINRSYQNLAEHYSVAVVPTRVRKPQDKAKVEEAVQNVQRRILARLDGVYKNVAEVNEAIRPLLEELNNRKQQVYGVSRWQLFQEVDEPALKALPIHAYTIAKWEVSKVTLDFHIEVDKHYYSVPYTLISKKVDVKIGEKSIEIFYNRQRVAIHLRSKSPGRHTTLPEHLPAHIRQATSQSSGDYLLWAENIGKETLCFIQQLLSSKANIFQGFRACNGMKSLERNYGKQRLESACKRANYFGLTEMKSVRNILINSQDKIPLETDSLSQIHELHENIRGVPYYKQ